MENDFGYDADFVLEDVPDDLKCVVCHLIMRKPVQIMTCGHRLCQTCLGRIEAYALHLNTPLLCPLDREIVDMNKVFDDTAALRNINNLEVKCSNFMRGCTWTGRLGSQQKLLPKRIAPIKNECLHEDTEDTPHPPLSHDEACDFRQQQLTPHAQQDYSAVLKSVDLLAARLAKVEESLCIKEKENANLLHNVENLNEKCGRHEKEITELRRENAALKNSITKIVADTTLLQNESKPIHMNKFNEIDKKVNNLSTQLNRKVSEETHRKRFEALQEKYKNMEERAVNLQHLNNKFDEHSTEYTQIKNRFEAIEKQVEGVSNLKPEFDALYTDGNENKEKWNNMENQIVDLQKDFEKVSTENTQVKEHCKLVEKHVVNLEDLLFCGSVVTGSSYELLIQWKIPNFSQIEKFFTAASPIFYTSIGGYAVQLKIFLRGDSIFFYGMQLHRSKFYVKQLEQFHTPFSLELLAYDGSVITLGKYDETWIENNKNYFEIPDGSDCAEWFDISFGTHLSRGNINRYPFNDALTVQCRFYPY